MRKDETIQHPIAICLPNQSVNSATWVRVFCVCEHTRTKNVRKLLAEVEPIREKDANSRWYC